VLAFDISLMNKEGRSQAIEEVSKEVARDEKRIRTPDQDTAALETLPPLWLAKRHTAVVGTTTGFDLTLQGPFHKEESPLDSRDSLSLSLPWIPSTLICCICAQHAINANPQHQQPFFAQEHRVDSGHFLMMMVP